ncbi:SIS domain-containing protein [Georgenia ruanii]|uniref:Glutamine--fructose-6-phosphate aminotransferase [isomerizing] n=1 Tax=Georgenia ruanii TaxID=348442 RepID=A0A7J9V350_9MICO|nr:SIS domain-containing protein [Georgenia ruanii]MPV90384.1 SIS domain-containing protein [Georgenia ruanii]
MKPEEFLADLTRKPEVLAALAASLREANPWRHLHPLPGRVVLLGMGSSAYAAGVAARRMRAQGLLSVAELASSDLLPRWGGGTLAVAISATGGSRETIDALGRLDDGATVTALTNVPGSPITRLAASTVLMAAEPELGGVACRSFQHTLVMLLALEDHLLGRPAERLAATVEKAAEATAHLLATEADWRPVVADLLLGPAGTHIAAPARRLSSAQQSALMLREGPRRAAVACESGDWAHVDVYLTKNTDYRLLSYAGSSWDDGILEWTLPRRTTVVSVGGDLEGAAYVLRYPHDDEDDVRLLTETLVAELVAARAWIAAEAEAASAPGR